MNKSIYKLFNVLLLLTASIYGKAQINAQFLGRYSIGTYNSNGGVAEISAYDPSTKRMYVVNGPDSSFRIVNMANPANPTLISTISVKPYGIDVTSITTNKKGLIAIAVIDSNGKTNPSNIVFLDANGNFISKVKAGANTDHIIFTSNGNKLLCANEGEPNVGYTIDPEGSISIIDVSAGASTLTQANVQTAGFTSFNGSALDSKIRIFGKIQTSGGTFLRNSTVAEDIEPEYIAISEDNTTAWITCQENNALAVLNINTATITSLIPLGFKNHNLAGNGLDPSDRSLNNTTAQAAIANWPVFGMYMPDGISSYSIGNQTYLVTANEGDARADWGAANNEEVRVNDVSYVLDTVKFGGASNVAALKANGALGRLNVTNRYGDFNNDGKFDSIFTFGARSFSIWNGATGALVWDSKDDFEQRTLAMFPANFNSGHTTNALDDRSDNKGPEPESVTIGKILDSTYAFVGLERIGGFMVYNITNPNAPYFVQYINTRNFAVSPSQGNLATVGDLGPEGIVFIPRNESPNGKDLILLSNEVSGTVAIFQINSRSAFQMQVLHASDMESGLDAVIDAPNFAAVLDTLEGTYTNTVKLASGDCFIPSPFLSAGEDPSMQAHLRSTAASYYPGSTAGLRAAIGRTDIAMMNIMGFQGSAFGNHEFDLGTPEVNSIIGVDIRNNGADKRWIGAQFPYLSANLNFANDINLSYLTTNQRLLVDSFKTSANITANSQKKGIAPSAIIETNGEKIGLVGATTQLLANISSPGLTTGLAGNSNNMPALAAVLQPVIDSLRAMGINKIIVMSHLQQLANEKALAPLLKGVDIIIAGGSHSLCADGNDRLRAGIPVADRYPILTVNNDNEPLAILNTTSEWKYIGRFVCDFDSLGRLIPNLLDSNINGAYAADTAMVTSLYGTYAAGFTTGSKGANVRTLTTAISNVINSKDGNKFGKSNVFLEGRRNAVRTEETNFGNLTADANLWYARQYDNQVRISIKNGGGIRSAIGNVNAVGSNVILENTLANPTAGKVRGDISQLDIENSLRFNNGLVIGTTNAAGLERILEHAISATNPAATPGQFPQVSGVMFSYDTTKVTGSRIQSLVIVDSIGNRLDTIVRNGMLVGDTTRTFKFVTLNFLYTGGDNYPFPTNAINRVNLDTAVKNTGIATFAAIGSEQDAFAEYMGTYHSSNAFAIRDTTLRGDRRIQQLNSRTDGVIVPNAGPNSSQTPYLTSVAPGVKFDAIISVGDMANNGYKMVGIPDGAGAYDNNNGTFTLLVNHELGSTVGITRAHGAKGAFVSKWVINKNNLSVVSGSDLIEKVNLYTTGTGYTLYNPTDTNSKKAFGRFCSADLPSVSAFYNSLTGLGTQERIFMNGEESGVEGRAFGHIVTGTNAGTTYELPNLGKFSWENAVASPASGNSTVVAGMDDGTDGQVYFYVGTKTNTGNEMDRAGLTNGRLYGIAVTGLPAEISLTVPAPNTPFTMVDLGIVKDSSGLALNTRSNALSVTKFLRPEDGLFDPSNPNDFYFVTTNSFSAPSKMWRLRFSDINNPTTGGTITAVLDGTEGPKMMDNIGIDKFGNIIIQEDVGNNAHLGKTWQYSIANDKLTLLASHDSTRFIAGGANFLTQDEEGSGIIDMQDILGAGNFLLVDQAHYGTTTELVEGGQILKMFNPSTANAFAGASPNSSQSPYLTSIASGVKFNSMLTVGDSANNGYRMAGIPDGAGAYDNGNGTFTMLVAHEIANTLGINRAHGAKGAFISKWVINKNDLSVINGADLIQKVQLYTPNVGFTLYNPADTNARKAFSRFCSADLPPVSAFYNAATGLGTQERIFMNGEESGPEGRAFGHIVTGTNAGTTWELPALGKFSWENSVAHPATGNKTVVVGTDDATPGQVYFYIGDKTNTGSEVEKAGLINGKLYGVSVAGLTTEVSASFPAPNTAFTLVDLGNIKDSSGASLNTRSNTLGVTNFLRPEDAAWDPSNHNDLYFVTTNGFNAPSRMWRLRFTNINNPLLGGTITAVLDGTEGQQMMDNLTIDKTGHILIQEDPGNNAHLAKIWQYTTQTDKMELIAQHDSMRFIIGKPNYLTQDEESSGIIDVQDILGAGQFLLVDQTHYSIPGELVEGGQILKMFNPASANGKQIISIAAARALNSDTVRVRGVITRAWGRFIYIQDATGAIAVRQSAGAMIDSILNGGLKEGDSVEVVGGRGNFNNYAQINIGSGAYGENSRITKLGVNATIPAPTVVTIKDINTNGEQYESKVVRIVGLRTNATAATFPSSSNNTVWDGPNAGDTTILRIIASQDTEIEDAPALAIPKGSFIFEGILAQFCSSPTSGCTNGYQIYGVRKKEITEMPLTAFSLLNPATNAKVTTDSASTALVQINWTKSANAVRYKWMLTTETGNFTNPLLSLLSNNLGADSLLTLTSGGVDAILASLNIANGDSVKTKWTVFAYKGVSDSLQASQVFNLTLARSKPIVITLGAFNLNAPANNARVEVEEANTSLVNINWTKSANAIRYRWFATTASGSFTTPLLRVNSNNAGVDTVLTLTSGGIDAILNSLNIKRTDSVTLKWTVYAYLSATDSLKATQDWNVKLVRKRILGTFNLTSPTNNARVEVEEGNATAVAINWSASAKASTYKWKAATLAGNFNAPLLNLNSDNAGADNKLTLTSGGIDAILASNGIVKGDSITLKWTVFAYETTDSLQAVETFNINLVRKANVGVNNISLSNQINVYPNPASSALTIATDNLTGNLNIKLYSLTGKLLIDKNVNAVNDNQIDVSQLQDGVYLLSVTAENGKSTQVKVVVMH